MDLDSISLWVDLKQLVLSSGKSHKSSHNRAKKVFLSHAVQYEVIILKTVAYMRSYLGMEVFVCADSIEYGQNWHSEIEGKLKEAELLLFLVSQSSVQSSFCAYEIGYARALGIPVRLVSQLFYTYSAVRLSSSSMQHCIKRAFLFSSASI